MDLISILGTPGPRHSSTKNSEEGLNIAFTKVHKYPSLHVKHFMKEGNTDFLADIEYR